MTHKGFDCFKCSFHVLFHCRVTFRERCTIPHTEGNEAVQMGSHGRRKNTWEHGRNSLLISDDPTEYLINHSLVQLSGWNRWDHWDQYADLSIKSSPRTKNSVWVAVHLHISCLSVLSHYLTPVGRKPLLPIFNQRSIKHKQYTIHLTASEGHHCDENWQMYTDNPSAAEGQTNLFDVVVLSIFLRINGLWSGCD